MSKRKISKKFFSLGTPDPEIAIVFDGQDTRKMVPINKEDGKKEWVFLYTDQERVSGHVKIGMKPGTKIEHQGIRIDLIGQLILFNDRGTEHDFLRCFANVARPGDLCDTQVYTFAFPRPAMPYESFLGKNCHLRYFLRVSIMKRLSDIKKECELAIHNFTEEFMSPDKDENILMDLGLEGSLILNFFYNKRQYDIKETVLGKVDFILVRIKVRYMELILEREESTGYGGCPFKHKEVITRHELMDGSPTRGESIPIRLFLAGYELTPTYVDVFKKFSIRYFLTLNLIDEDERCYFRREEIILYRKRIEKPKKPKLKGIFHQPKIELKIPKPSVCPTTPKKGASNLHQSTATQSNGVPPSTSENRVPKSTPALQPIASQLLPSTFKDCSDFWARAVTDDQDGQVFASPSQNCVFYIPRRPVDVQPIDPMACTEAALEDDQIVWQIAALEIANAKNKKERDDQVDGICTVAEARQMQQNAPQGNSPVIEGPNGRKIIDVSKLSRKKNSVKRIQSPDVTTTRPLVSNDSDDDSALISSVCEAAVHTGESTTPPAAPAEQEGAAAVLDVENPTFTRGMNKKR